MTTRFRRCVVNLLPGLLLVSLLPLLTGCFGAMPLPALSNKVTYGSRVTSGCAASIKPGRTTRAEVYAALGTNCLSAPDQRALAYSWEVKGGGGVWWGYSADLMYGSPDVSGRWAGSWAGGWRAFFVAFDEQGVVTATAFKRPSTGKSLHQHLDEWVTGLSAKGRTGAAHTVVAPSAPD